MRYVVLLILICFTLNIQHSMASEKDFNAKIKHFFPSDDFEYFKPPELREICNEIDYDERHRDIKHDEISLQQTKCGAMIQFFNYNFIFVYHLVAKSLPPVSQHRMLEDAYRCNRLPVLDTRKSINKFNANLMRNVGALDIGVGFEFFIFPFDLYKYKDYECYNKYEIGNEEFDFQIISDFIDKTCVNDSEERYCRHLIESFFNAYAYGGLYSFSNANEYYDKDEYNLAKTDKFKNMLHLKEYQEFIYPEIDENIYSKIKNLSYREVTTLDILKQWKAIKENEVFSNLSLYAFLVNYNQAKNLYEKSERIRRLEEQKRK